MPVLPTLTVTNEQAQRILAAFGSQEAYKEWLKDNVISFVVSREAAVAQAEILTDSTAAQAELATQITTT